MNIFDEFCHIKILLIITFKPACMTWQTVRKTHIMFIKTFNWLSNKSIFAHKQ